MDYLVVLAQSANKQSKIYSYGREEVLLEKE